MAKNSDMPTVARIRARLVDIGTEDITVDQAKFVFGVTTNAPIMLRIERGELSAAKVLGEWRIDASSIHAYLDSINSNYNRSI